MSKRNAGYRRWGFEEIWNNLRWVRQCQTTGKPYSLNNNFKRFYAELLMAREPSLSQFFKLRRTKQELTK